MRALLLTSIIATSIIGSGCTVFVRTESVSASIARPVPHDRVLAFQESRDGFAKVVITRDAGFMGSGCYFGVTADSILIARFDTSESATFYMPPGEIEMAVVRDPLGRGLCAIQTSAPAIEKQSIRPDITNHFRISLRAYRRPQLIPVPGETY